MRFLHFGRKQNDDDQPKLQSVPRRRLTSATDTGQSIIQRRITWTDGNVNNDDESSHSQLQREVADLKYENAKLRARLGRRPSYDHVTRLPQHSQTLTGKRGLIIGGGPAGLALAVSLHQRGCEVRVHERSTVGGELQNKKKKGFGWLLMPNGVTALDALGIKESCLGKSRAIETMEVYLSEDDEERSDIDEIFCCTREDLILGMMKMLPQGCVIRGSTVLAIESKGISEETEVTAVKVLSASGHEVLLQSRQFDEDEGFDYVFGADGVHSILARQLNPDMDRHPGGSTNTIVTCLKDEVLAQQLGTRFIKTYFRNKAQKQCCAFGLLSPSRGVVLGFMQFSTKLHGTAPYESGNNNMQTEVRGFIHKVLNLPLPPEDNKSDNIRRLRTYLGILNQYDFDYHIWRFVPSGYASTSHGVNCAILGDALHPMSDFSSQGVSSAIEDAVSLGRCLSAQNVDTDMTVLQMYDSERRNVVLRYITAGERILNDFLTDGEKSSRRRDSFCQPFSKGGSSRSNSFKNDCGRSDSKIPTDSSQSPFHEQRLSKEGTDDHDFLDPSLVNMSVLSTNAYNYRWATLPNDVIPLTAASSDFPVCPAIINALKEHIQQGYFCYGPNEGLPHFREAFAAYFSERLTLGVAFCKEQEDGNLPFGITSIDAAQVMATNAAAAAVYASASATILHIGDEALVMSPVDFLLSNSVSAMGGVVIRFSIKTRNCITRPTFDLVEMETLVTPRTRMLSICNPHNPLGRAWSLKELRDLVDFAERHKLSIVSDEVWGDMVHAPRIHIPTACVSPYAASNTYTIYGFSKSHGLEGLRIGALVAPSPDELTKVLTLSHTDTTANGASVIAQVAAIAAMTEAGSWLVSWKLHLHACVKHAITRLNMMEGVHANLPESCFVIWVDVSSILYPLHNQHVNTMSDNDDDVVVTEEEGEEPEMKLMQWLIHEHNVCIIPGLERFFGPGSKGHIRISVATSKAILDSGLDRLELGLKLWPQCNSKN